MAKLRRPKSFKDRLGLPSAAMLAAIGRTVVVSASIEDFLHSLHWKFAGLNDVVGQVITGDARPTRLADDIIRVARAANVDEKILEDLSDIFAEYKSLAAIRNQCIHWIWEDLGGANHKISPPVYKAGHKPRTFSVQEIESLADDLIWIETRLSVHEMNEADIRKEREKYPAALADVFVPAPWLR